MAKNTGALVLGILGAIISVITVIPGLIFLWKVIIKPALFPANLKKYQGTNTYAVVTGAAGGIGRGFAKRFAKEGYNLIIFDRAEQQLKELKEELEKEYKVKVDSHVVDFIKMDREDKWDDMKEILKDYDIGVLVNNVGMVQTLPAMFGDMDQKDFNNMVTLNIRTMLMMTHICLPLMKARAGKGLIINMSSSTAGFPHPMIQIYSSTKAFTKQFSDSIHAEYRGKIDVIAYAPWYIKTEMTKIRETAIYALTPEDFVDCSFKYFGQQNHIDPFWFHYLMDIGSWCIPEKFFSDNVIAQQSFVRKRFLIRMNKAAEDKKDN
ncbi:Estradiol 17-beta-dehydrogenase [Entamoeba marina]